MKDQRRKISAKVWRPVIDKLNRKLDRACLRRDAYLEQVLALEIPLLDAELPIANSAEARRFISERLDELDRKLVSFALRVDLVEQLDDICARKGIVRDAFFNRLLFILASPKSVIDRIFFTLDTDQRWRTDVWSEYKHDGPFFQNVFYPLEQEIDPFWPIRAGLEMCGEEDGLIDHTDMASGQTYKIKRLNDYGITLPERLYTVTFDNETFKDADLFGLNCYLPDWQIPKHPAQVKFRKHLDELLESL